MSTPDAQPAKDVQRFGQVGADGTGPDLVGQPGDDIRAGLVYYLPVDADGLQGRIQGRLGLAVVVEQVGQDTQGSPQQSRR